MFYTFNQSNPGGGFAYDASAGISVWVIIEAESAAQANARAESIGLYFNGVDNDQDCPCCGDRWYETADREATSQPSLYASVDALTYRGEYFSKNGETPWNIGRWMAPERFEGFVHYLDGTVVGFWGPPTKITATLIDTQQLALTPGDE